MGQVRAQGTLRCRAIDPVAGDALTVQEHFLTFGGLSGSCGHRLSLPGCPNFKLIGGDGNDGEIHIGMLNPAQFGALAPEVPRLVGLKPHGVGLAGHDIRFAGQAGYPEAMDDIIGR
jgi:hypothetical protein